jgi:hypothetical protein
MYCFAQARVVRKWMESWASVIALELPCIFGQFTSAISPATAAQAAWTSGYPSIVLPNYAISAAPGKRLQRSELNYLATAAISACSEPAHLQKLGGDYRAIEQT